MKNIYPLLAGIVVIIGLVAFVIFSEVYTPKDTDAIKIGVVYGFTGPAAKWSEFGKHALELAVNEINDKGGVNGRPLQLVYEDSQTTPAGSVSAFQKLVDVDQVDVVVGDVWSFITNPLIPVADAAGVVLISPTVMNKAVESTSPYFFTTGHTVEGQEDSVRKFFRANPDIKTASILGWNDAWGNAHSDLFRAIAQEEGITVVSEEYTADFSDDYRTLMSKIKAKNPDAILATFGYADPALKAYTELGMTQKILTTTVVVDAIETRNMPREYAKNVWVMDWVPSPSFINKYQTKYGTYPILEAQNHYEVIRSIARALEESPGNLLEGLKSVKYESVDGMIDFTQGDNITVNRATTKLYTVGPVSGYHKVK